MSLNFIKKILLTSIIIYISGAASAQEDIASSSNKLTFHTMLSAQTPLSIPNGFYNKNYQTTNYFRSGYALGLDFRINDKWQLTTMAGYYQSFVEQHFYFGGFGDDADFNYKHISPELGFNLGINRTLVATEKSRLSWSIELQPWFNLSDEIKSTTRRIPDGLGGDRDSQVIIRPVQKLNLAVQTGLRYDYFGNHLSYGFALDMHFRQSSSHPFELMVDNWFSYSSSYATSASLLSISGFIGF